MEHFLVDPFNHKGNVQIVFFHLIIGRSNYTKIKPVRKFPRLQYDALQILRLHNFPSELKILSLTY